MRQNRRSMPKEVDTKEGGVRTSPSNSLSRKAERSLVMRKLLAYLLMGGRLLEMTMLCCRDNIRVLLTQEL
jgi:hypothetical protein